MTLTSVVGTESDDGLGGFVSELLNGSPSVKIVPPTAKKAIFSLIK